MKKNQPDWYTIGKPHIWHPYTQEKITQDPITISHTSGCKIYLDDGTELIDGIASWWSACHGYNHPHIQQTVEKQLKIMPHIMFAGTSHEQAYMLAARLSKLTNLPKVFFSDSGSTAVETAMKMATQYWYNLDNKAKYKFLSFHNGYHGDTMGCMSLCDQKKGMHKHFNKFMPMQYNVAIPSSEYGFSEFESLLQSQGQEIAAVIIEPLIQGAGGMKFHTADVLAEIYRITKKHNILFIADEIMTGFGRTGMMFAIEETGITPDIMCLGKALTGGTMTLSATLATEEIYEPFYDDQLEKALMSGPTFMANPLACSAANASLDLFEQENYIKKIEHLEQSLYQLLKPFQTYKQVINVRVKGGIGAIQLQTDWNEIFAMREAFIKEGVFIRPFGDIIYLMPPFIISDKELIKLVEAIDKILYTFKKQ